MRKKIIFMMMSMFLLCGCNNRTVSNQNGTGADIMSTESDDGSCSESTDSGTDIDCVNEYEAYVKKFYDERVNISQYKEKYVEQTEELKKNATEKLAFDACNFGSIEAVEKAYILKSSYGDISAKESWKVIREWLKEIGVTNIDMDKEVRDVSGQCSSGGDGSYPYNYPSVAKNFSEMKTGSGFFLNTNTCYLQMMGDGIYSMSDGTITKYLNIDGFAAMDALGVNTEKVVKSGKLADLESDAWELILGKVMVKDAADMTKKYFEKGTPFPCASGVEVDIPEVSIFSLNDKYGYAFTVRRKYKGIPFAYTAGGGRNYYEDGYSISEDMKTAYVVNNKDVSAFTGYSEAQSLETDGGSQDSIISLKEAVSILNEELAVRINVQVSEVELVYCTIVAGNSSNEEGEIVLPCWEFDGIDTINQQKIRIYLDVFTGEIYYYTYT